MRGVLSIGMFLSLEQAFGVRLPHELRSEIHGGAGVWVTFRLGPEGLAQ